LLIGFGIKWKYQRNKRSNSWESSIIEHRKRIRDSFQKHPTLKNYFREIFSECYHNARDLAADETGLNINTFPIECPFAKEDILKTDYLPN
jgi:hypothetical protein